MNYADASAYLDEHVNLERLLGTGRPEAPSLERMQRLVSAMGDPQHVAPVIHITGTNGKGSTAQIVTRLLVAQGLTVGTYTSPHLERVNERITPQRRADLATTTSPSRSPPSPTSRSWPACGRRASRS